MFVSLGAGAYRTAHVGPRAGGAFAIARPPLAVQGKGCGAPIRAGSGIACAYAAISAVQAAASRTLLLPLRPSHSRPVARATNPLMGRLQGGSEGRGWTHGGSGSLQQGWVLHCTLTRRADGAETRSCTHHPTQHYRQYVRCPVLPSPVEGALRHAVVLLRAQPAGAAKAQLVLALGDLQGKGVSRVGVSREQVMQ